LAGSTGLLRSGHWPMRLPSNHEVFRFGFPRASRSRKQTFRACFQIISVARTARWVLGAAPVGVSEGAILEKAGGLSEIPEDAAPRTHLAAAVGDYLKTRPSLAAGSLPLDADKALTHRRIEDMPDPMQLVFPVAAIFSLLRTFGISVSSRARASRAFAFRESLRKAALSANDSGV
jgi:hypothetical protein